MQGARSAGGWGPARHLHLNVFEAISALAIIPVALGDKYRRGLKSPSGRQAGRQRWGACRRGCVAINKSATHLPSRAAHSKPGSPASDALPRHAVPGGPRRGAEGAGPCGPCPAVWAAGSSSLWALSQLRKGPGQRPWLESWGRLCGGTCAVPTPVAAVQHPRPPSLRRRAPVAERAVDQGWASAAPGPGRGPRGSPVAFGGCASGSFPCSVAACSSLPARMQLRLPVPVLTAQPGPAVEWSLFRLELRGGRSPALALRPSPPQPPRAFLGFSPRSPHLSCQAASSQAGADPWGWPSEDTFCGGG